MSRGTCFYLSLLFWFLLQIRTILSIWFLCWTSLKQKHIQCKPRWKLWLLSCFSLLKMVLQGMQTIYVKQFGALKKCIGTWRIVYLQEFSTYSYNYANVFLYMGCLSTSYGMQCKCFVVSCNTGVVWLSCVKKDSSDANTKSSRCGI